jgi:multicomponent K+:H+ antiporter subunit G
VSPAPLTAIPDALPLWVAVLVALLAVGGATLSFLGTLGLVRLPNFYERVHAPTLGATLGMWAIIAASILLVSVLEGRLVLRDLLVGAFLTVTTPVTLLLLARAAAFRDRVEGNPGAPEEP